MPEPIKKTMKLTDEEINDLLSAVGFWHTRLDKKENPKTNLALMKLTARLWKVLRDK